jgi:hypothetical protein
MVIVIDNKLLKHIDFRPHTLEVRVKKHPHDALLIFVANPRMCWLKRQI